MKIKTLLFSVLIFFPFVAQAQLTVVRIKNNQIYLDTSTVKGSLQKGNHFKVILSSEKLTNPKTGKDLGLVYNYSEVGEIIEVQPLYAVGEIHSTSGISVGQEAVLEEEPTPAPAVAKASGSKTAENTQHQKISYQPVEQEIIGLAEAAFIQPDAQNIITLSNKGQITVWNRGKETLTQVSFYQLPKGKTPVALSAAPVRNPAATAEIFAVVYDPNTLRISTLVLAYENNQWNLLDTLPYYVKELGCSPEKTLWMQKPFVSDSIPGNARQIIYQNGKFQPGTKTLSTRRNWLSGMSLFPLEKAKEPSLIYTSSYGKIKLDLPNGKSTQSKEVSAGAPNRVKYKQDILKFYPSLLVITSDEKPSVAAVENTTKLGLLSEAFGQYDSGKIHFLSFEKGRLVLKDTVALDGFVYDTACSARGILTAEILPDGQSSVVEIFNN
ncbi:MAG: hypothetical protein IKO35_03560 [Elusimicrobiaceae bacterium]|nr:hypothetical protein [Elusimicrobiaceae bacterium]